ncbi:MAG: glycosyltransferase [Lachnospiraceae bacterium]|jgi:glycosyltransferase involved in cell wall biosynthesis|nr:glycosyltransferase [Lachnospiraceae bacterium]
MKSQKSVTLVLAGYNEESNIERSMELSYKALEKAFYNYELILIDDASKDCTLEKMYKFAEEHINVRVLPNYINLNFGTSVLRGLLMANYDYIVYNACDLPLAPDDMIRVLVEEENADVIVLERIGYKTTKWRKITSDLNKLLLTILFPALVKGTPVLNFVQIYKRDKIRSIIPLARSPIFVWPELIFRAKLSGLYVKNVPVKCNIENLRKGSFGHPHDIIWGIYDMLRFRIRVWKKDY